MSLTQDDIKQIGAIVVEVTSPMFEQLGGKLDVLEGRMDNLEGRMESLEHEMRDFKAEVRTKLATLESKVHALESSNSSRFENVEDDVRLLYRLVNKLEHGTAEEKIFAEKTIIQHLPAIHKAVQIIAKQNNIPLT